MTEKNSLYSCTFCFRDRCATGLNTVVREIVMCLRRQYGVATTYGIPSGYRGFRDPSSWIELDEKKVRNFHNMGGSFLGSSRGGHDTNVILNSLVAKGVNLLFVTGGDGTVRGAGGFINNICILWLHLLLHKISPYDNFIMYIQPKSRKKFKQGVWKLRSQSSRKR